MGLIFNSKCEHCGENKKIISAGSTYTDGFCKECLELVIFDCEYAIQEIKDWEEQNG